MSNQQTPLSEELSKEIEDKAQEVATSEYNYFKQTAQFRAYEDGWIAGATAYAIWKVQANEAKKLLERIIMDHALGIEMNVELYRQIKTFLDGSK